jgi:preprotein translocase subunit SecF
MEFFHKKTSIGFMAQRRIWYVVSAVVLIAAMVSFLVRGLNLGIDFTGGVVLELEFPQAADLEKVRWNARASRFCACRRAGVSARRVKSCALLPQEGRTPTRSHRA